MSRFFSFRVLFAFTIFFASENLNGQCFVNPRIRKIDANVSPRIQTFMEYLPLDYNTNPTAKYPVLIYWPGVGEALGEPGGGVEGLCNLLRVSLPNMVNNNLFPEPVLDQNNQPFSYIVIAPLMLNFANLNNVTECDSVINYLVNNYRIDTRRIYTTGISFGAYLLMDHATSSVASAQKLAAVNPQANCFPDTMANFASKLANIVNANVNVWGIHCAADSTCPATWIQGWVNGMNNAQPGLAQYTSVTCPDRAHAVWAAGYETTFKVNNKNVYEWLLQYTSNYVVSRQIFSVNSGDWNNPATWSCNCIPNAIDHITIKAGHTVNITPAMGQIQVRTLIQEPGSIFNVNGSFKITND